jgi:hypothetical protein
MMVFSCPFPVVRLLLIALRPLAGVDDTSLFELVHYNSVM